MALEAFPACFETSRRIEFSDTDVAGIVHFSRFYIFMETAEHQFLNSLGTSVHAREGDVLIGWPRLAASCEFARPVRFEDTLDIRLAIARLGTKSVTYEVVFQHHGELIARGKITSVCCIIETGRRPQSIPIPEGLKQKMRQAITNHR